MLIVKACSVVSSKCLFSKKQLVHGIKLGIVYKRNRAKMSTMFSIEEAVVTGQNVLILEAAGTGKSSLVQKLFQK